MTKEATDFDVAVVGGGPAGTTAANRLACLGRSVILLESSSYDSPRVGETLPPSICPTLIDLGVWESFQSLAPMPSYGTQSVWGDNEIRSNSFMFNPYGLGWHIDRLKFDSMLAARASKCGARVITGVRVKNFNWKPLGHWEIGFELNRNKQGAGGSPVCCSHLFVRGLIDATGRNSVLSKRLGANHTIYDRLSGVAIMFQARPEVDVGAYTLVEASEEGWWYSAPVPGHRLIASYMTDMDLISINKPLNVEKWMTWLASTRFTSVRCWEHSILWGPHIFSALSQRLNMPRTEEKWLATGDSAMAVDPLSSSGIPNAFLSGARAAAAMDRWLDGDHRANYIYENEFDNEFKEYLRLRHDYYSMETRWPDSTFWKRRQQL
jgi:flavin-dependent dehydrogenase